MMLLAIILAATLSAGNAEFEKTATKGAFDITVGREKARLVAEGPAKGALAKAMLAKPEAFAKAEAAKDESWTVYQKMIEAEYATLCRLTGERLGVAETGTASAFWESDMEQAKRKFEARYAEERAAACAEQAETLVGVVRPSESEFETKDEGVLKKEMAEKVASQQKTAVFEENLGYISDRIVEPVLESAKKERKRQGEYLRRVKSDAYAPSVLAKDLTDKLTLHVKERRAKAADPALAWGVFPSVTNVTLRNAVHHRTMDRMATKVSEIPFVVKREDVAKTIAANRVNHRKANESKDIFRRTWAFDLCMQSANAVREEAPKAEQKEIGEYLTKHASDELVTKAVNKRMVDQMLPKLSEVRRELADEEFVQTWPTLVDRTWFPDAETADETSARSDYAAAVRAWREMPKVELAKGEGSLEESSARADKAVATAFEIARSAVTAQTRIVDEVHPSVLAEAREKKDSFWSRTPDFGKMVAMLAEAVEKRWAGVKAGTLWPKGDAPENADEQHAELFPSVRKRIELVAKSIVAEINKPDIMFAYAISAHRTGDRVTVKIVHGSETVFEKNPKANMDDFRKAMKELVETYGREVLDLK